MTGFDLITLNCIRWVGLSSSTPSSVESPFHLPSRLGLQNTSTASLQKSKTPPANECLGYDSKQSDGEVSDAGALGNEELPFNAIALLPGPLWPGMEALDWALSMGWIELDCILMLNWIVWIRTVRLNWIAWNRNVFDT